MRRMDRYKEEDSPRASRLDKNKDLYQNISSNTIYTNITDVTNANAYEINNSHNNNNNSSHTTREAYQTMRKYQNVEPVHRNKKELDDFNYLYQKKETKIYDINSVLEEARKNRQEKDSLDEKRKLKNNAYNILSGINKEELEKYREEKKKRITTPEEDEIREIIDTIASKTLAGELDKETTVDLLSDLMATNIFDKVDGSEELAEQEEAKEAEVVEDKEEKTPEETPTEDLAISKQVLNTEQIEEIKDKKDTKKEEDLPQKDPDFYTRSMDLSDKDFDLNEEFKEGKLPLPVKILLFLLIVAVIIIAGYFIFQRMQ